MGYQLGSYFASKTITAGYMMEDMEKQSATLIFRQKGKTEDSTGRQSQSPERAVGDEEKLVPLATFRSWKKLPQRLNLWAFKFDPDDPLDLSVSEGGGFPRPQLLPMADIFRSSG